MRWVWRGITGATLVFGWLFILWQNKFHIDPPVVVVMLAYLATVLIVTNLWRVGATAVSPERGDDSWERPLGERGELEREKRTLLRSIKDAEFDLAMGKLSKVDADQLIQMYRARAIEVIKELDRLDEGTAATPRQKIEREVAARLKVEAAAEQTAKKAKGKKADKADKADAKADKADKADAKADKADTVEATADKPGTVDAKAATADAKTAKADKAADDTVEPSAEVAASAASDTDKPQAAEEAP